MRKIRYFILTLLSLCMMLFVGCGGSGDVETKVPQSAETVSVESLDEKTTADEAAIDIDGVYTSKEDVALYIYTYGELPQNFMTKKEAKALGWEGGSLEPYAPGMCIGGDTFGNYE